MSDAVVRPEACDAELDASGLSCPLPLLKAKMELNRLASGAVLKVISTDAGSQRDFRTFARLAGMNCCMKKPRPAFTVIGFARPDLSPFFPKRMFDVQCASQLGATLLL